MRVFIWICTQIPQIDILNKIEQFEISIDEASKNTNLVKYLVLNRMYFFVIVNIYNQVLKKYHSPTIYIYIHIYIHIYIYI